MRAWVADWRQAGQACVRDVPEPADDPALLQVQAIANGVCGTDREIISGGHGAPPSGQDYLVLGHESLGRVTRAPKDSGFSEGDLVCGIVRRPDPVPCGACAHGEPDMCRNGEYTERGIKGLDGYASERWTIEPEYAVKVSADLGLTGVLVEPASVLAKAWEHIEHIGSRSWFEPKNVLVTGAGPIGLLAAMLGVQRGLETHVLDRATDGPKPAAVTALGAIYHSGPPADVAQAVNPEIVIECTGAGPVLAEVIRHNATAAIVCLEGVSTPAGRVVEIDPEELNRHLVLENDVVFGTVNAARRHYTAAVDALAAADHAWLASLLTRCLPLDRYADVLKKESGDIKVVLTF
jgi:threonine dehydrogenase-like Zn-dependent dehydrogenase